MELHTGRVSWQEERQSVGVSYFFFCLSFLLVGSIAFWLVKLLPQFYCDQSRSWSSKGLYFVLVLCCLRFVERSEFVNRRGGAAPNERFVDLFCLVASTEAIARLLQPKAVERHGVATLGFLVCLVC